MFIVQLFNLAALPSYDGMTEAYEGRMNDPFEGIEIIGVCDTEDEVNYLITKYQEQYENPNRPFKFHYEEVRDEIVSRWIKS